MSDEMNADDGTDNKGGALNDGTLAFRINDGPHAGETITLDILAARVAIQAVELKHNVTGEFVMTPEFLADLVAAVKSVGVEYCSPTLAAQIWHRVTDAWIELKKNTGL